MRSIVLIITAVAVLVSFDPLAITAQQRPGSAPSPIQVHLSARLTCHGPTVQRALYRAYATLDWAALTRLVEPG
jgi:hypothetical protein